MNVERYFCNFFLVGFYGKEFPRSLQVIVDLEVTYYSEKLNLFL
jgi:hypothetical protein